MDPISNVDRLVILLRQRLLERSKTAGSARAKGPAGRTDPAAGRSAIQALAALEGGDERHLKRTLIQNILADQLGAEVLNDAKFQQVVDRVTDTLEAGPETSLLLSKVVDDLRASVR